MAYRAPHYPETPRPDTDPEGAPLVIVGAGLVGLTLALDLGLRGVATVLLDEDTTIADGSRAIVFARRSLEILARLGLGKRLLEKGVAWESGTIFLGEEVLQTAKIIDDPLHEYPLFLNIQQYYVEEWLVEACQATGNVDLRWGHKLEGVYPMRDHVALQVSTSAGGYCINAQRIVACDGASSVIRKSLNFPFVGRVFRDRFLIADVRFEAELPAERRFWFSPSFHLDRSVLLHKQPDDIWRVDFQLGWEADPITERNPERVKERLTRMFGNATPFELIWASVYTFQSRRLERFVHDRVIFAGDSAHQVSPFGGRGGNGGIQDADNLGWKLAAVTRGEANDDLLASYNAERCFAADENILHSTRSAEFITPKSLGARALRDATLLLGTQYSFARNMINSGRLSNPSFLIHSPLNFSQGPNLSQTLPLGAPAPDVPLSGCCGQDWFLRNLKGDGFSIVRQSRELESMISIDSYPETSGAPIQRSDSTGLFTQRYGTRPGDMLLFRPDQHLAARLSEEQASLLPAAHDHALARGRGS